VTSALAGTRLISALRGPQQDILSRLRTIQGWEYSLVRLRRGAQLDEIGSHVDGDYLNRAILGLQMYYAAHLRLNVTRGPGAAPARLTPNRELDPVLEHHVVLNWDFARFGTAVYGAPFYHAMGEVDDDTADSMAQATHDAVYALFREEAVPAEYFAVGRCNKSCNQIVCWGQVGGSPN
jgi:hypothetical protein